MENTTKTQINIFLVEDHVIVRQGLRLLIEAQPDMKIVGESADARTTIAAIQETQPDVVVMDIRLAHGNGLRLTEEIRKLELPTRVLMLTQYETLAYLRHAVKAGATGYILKLSSAEVLISAIRMVARGEATYDPILRDKMVNSYLGRTASVESLIEVDLSEREEEVLRELAWGKSNKEIADLLQLGTKSIETYRKRACEKLGFQSRAEIVRYAVDRGWLTQE